LAEADSFSRWLVAGVHSTLPSSDKQPAYTAAYSSDKVDGIERVSKSAQPPASALVRGFTISIHVGYLISLEASRVGLPWEGPEMQDGEEGHFNTDD
jgi:hypothetical protein